MDGTLVKEISDLTLKTQIVDIDGKPWSSRSFSRVIHDPRPEALKATTLNAIKDFFESLSEEDREDVFAVVPCHTHVNLVSGLNPETMSRKNYLSVELPSLDGFRFGNFYDIESFQVALRSLFKPESDLTSLLEFTASILTFDQANASDDGISQTVVVKRGLSGAIKDGKIAPSNVSLRPYRTFREVEQPKSEFIFRMRGESGRLPTLALFECDGGAWRITAVASIRKFLEEKIPGLKVIA